MQTLEDTKKFGRIPHIETRAVVLDAIDVLRPFAVTSHFNEGRISVAGIFEGVRQQVVENYDYHRTVARGLRQWVDSYPRYGLRIRSGLLRDCLSGRGFHVD